MFILKKGHQPGVYVPLRALFLVAYAKNRFSHDEPHTVYAVKRTGTDQPACKCTFSALLFFI